MQETLAAGVVLATGLERERAISSTPCAAAARSRSRRPFSRSTGLRACCRTNFGFMHRKGFNDGEWNELREKAKQAAGKSFPGRIIASDNDPLAVEAARKNALTAGVEHLIEFHVCDYARNTSARVGCHRDEPSLRRTHGRDGRSSKVCTRASGTS